MDDNRTNENATDTTPDATTNHDCGGYIGPIMDFAGNRPHKGLGLDHISPLDSNGFAPDISCYPAPWLTEPALTADQLKSIDADLRWAIGCALAIDAVQNLIPGLTRFMYDHLLAIFKAMGSTITMIIDRGSDADDRMVTAIISIPVRRGPEPATSSSIQEFLDHLERERLLRRIAPFGDPVDRGGIYESQPKRTDFGLRSKYLLGGLDSLIMQGFSDWASAQADRLSDDTASTTPADPIVDIHSTPEVDTNLDDPKTA